MSTSFIAVWGNGEPWILLLDSLLSEVSGCKANADSYYCVCNTTNKPLEDKSREGEFNLNFKWTWKSVETHFWESPRKVECGQVDGGLLLCTTKDSTVTATTSAASAVAVSQRSTPCTRWCSWATARFIASIDHAGNESQPKHLPLSRGRASVRDIDRWWRPSARSSCTD